MVPPVCRDLLRRSVRQAGPNSAKCPNVALLEKEEAMEQVHRQTSALAATRTARTRSVASVMVALLRIMPNFYYTTAGSYIEGPNARAMPEMFRGPPDKLAGVSKRGCRAVRGDGRSAGPDSDRSDLRSSFIGRLAGVTVPTTLAS